MPSTNPPIKNTAYTTYVSLVSQADTKLFKTTVTLAAGDVKVSKDGGAFSNIGTLPTEISTTGVLALALTNTEMNADTVAVLFRDAAGAEWCDLLLTIHTVVANFDTLAAYLDTEVAAILAAVDTEVAAIKAKTDNLPTDPADDSDIDAQLSAIAANVTAILDDTGTSGVVVASIANDAITAAAIAAGAIDAGAIASDAITAAKIATGAITSAKFAAGAITAAAIATDAIDDDAISSDAVTAIQNGIATAASVAALNNLSAAQVNAEVLDVLAVDTFAEPSAVPAATSSLKDKLSWLFTLARNKLVQSSSAQTLYRDDGTTTTATATVSDDGTVATRQEWS